MLRTQSDEPFDTPTDFTTFDHGSDLEQFAANWSGPFFKNSWNVAPLTNHSDNSDETLSEWFVHDIVFSNRAHQQAGSSTEVLPPAQRSLILCNELCALVQIIEVSARQFFAPSRARPGSRFTQVCGRSCGQNISRTSH
jgi:hypothetical protein